MRKEIKLQRRTEEEFKSYIDGYNKAVKDLKHFMKYFNYSVEEALIECETRSKFMTDCMEDNYDD